MRYTTASKQHLIITQLWLQGANTNDSGGTEAVNHVSQHLHTHLEQHFTSPKASTAAEYKHAIQCALRALDRDLDRDDLSGGSTVSLVLIDTKQSLLVEADLGDSHVFFADHEPQSPQSSHSPESPSRVDSGSSAPNGWNVEMLSVEHSPDNPTEKKRIEDAGGEVNYRSGIARIGGVSMSRALGDLEYKKPRVNRLAGHNLSDLDGVETGLAPGRTAIYDLVSNKATFAVRHLNGQSLILLASDGVGDAKDAEEVTRLAVDRWQQGAEAKEIAEEITKREGKAKGADNCTVVVVVLDTEGKGRRSIDSGVGRRSLDVPEAGGRRRRRSSIASLKDWIRDR
jgi:serine/threonine protein phosphatase PrpC